jgi:hypothetical protein
MSHRVPMSQMATLPPAQPEVTKAREHFRDHCASRNTLTTLRGRADQANLVALKPFAAVACPRQGIPARPTPTPSILSRGSNVGAGIAVCCVEYVRERSNGRALRRYGAIRSCGLFPCSRPTIRYRSCRSGRAPLKAWRTGALPTMRRGMRLLLFYVEV